MINDSFEIATQKSGILAVEMYNKAASDYLKNGNHYESGLSFTISAKMLELNGLYRQSAANYIKASEQFNVINNPDAKSSLEYAIVLLEKENNHHITAKTFEQLALFNLKEKNLDETIKNYEKAAYYYEKCNFPKSWLDCLLNASDIILNSGSYEFGLDYMYKLGEKACQKLIQMECIKIFFNIGLLIFYLYDISIIVKYLEDQKYFMLTREYNLIFQLVNFANDKNSPDYQKLITDHNSIFKLLPWQFDILRQIGQKI